MRHWNLKAYRYKCLSETKESTSTWEMVSDYFISLIPVLADISDSSYEKRPSSNYLLKNYF